MFKKFALITAIFATALSFVSCSGSSVFDTMTPPMAPRPEASDYSASNEMSQTVIAEDGETEFNTSVVSEQIDRKVIFNSSFDLQTKDYDQTLTRLDEMIASTKSYVEKSNTYGDKETGDASINMTIRIPSDKYEEFKAEIAELGNIISSSESGSDVTGDYFDTEARLTVLSAQEKRVLELLTNAKNIEDILKIETELSRIRSEIEQLTTVIKRYDDLISYSTIDISIQQAKDYIVKNETFFDKIGSTFDNSLHFGLELIKNLVYIFVWVSPYAMVLGLILVIVLLIVKASQKKNKAKKNLPPVNIQK